MEGETSRSSKIAEDVIQTLKTRGWCIGDLDQVNAIVLVQSALSDDGKASTIADSVESQLLDMDLRSIGGKSLPDAISFRKASHLQGRKVLQISSMRDVAVSTIDAFSSSGHRRLLKLVLTDGHSEIPAVEYSHLPSVGNDIAPGAKVRVENKATIHSGILCLNPKVMTVIGGVVQSLYDEWHMNQKYSVFSRSSLRPTEDGGVAGPPAFAKLQAGASSIRPSSQRSRVSDYFQAISKSSMPVAEGFVTKPEVGLENVIKQAENVVDKVKTLEAKENAQWRPLPYAMGPREGYSASTS
ncbi:unnamed protein product [Linum tenue]|uniref:RecQ mediated genome instability protein 1 OB-fold domain-containing protein n=1 Tax=Linum tenue TaxID=586396 RepID=A0AAV0IQG1_9ROSI|nr:unnamed protein product [Linum tenue]